MKKQAISDFLVQAAGAVLFGFIATSVLYAPIDQALQSWGIEACDEFYEFGSDAHGKCVRISRIQAARRQTNYAYPLLALNTALAGIIIRQKIKQNQRKP